MADSRNDHNSQDKRSHDNNNHKGSSRNDHNSQDKRSHDNNHKGSSRNDHNNQRSEDNAGNKADVASVGSQNINCMGSFMNCRNDITTFVCAHVTYCFIGPTSPFMMANPTSQ